MQILVSPDKFKGSLSALEAGEAISRGLTKALPDAKCTVVPMADGGEGTAEIFRRALNGRWIEVKVHDALGRIVTGKYAWIEESRTAVIEMSEASGLWRLGAGELSPMHASTYGTGELMAHAAGLGAETIYVGLGGSATNDAGAGMAAALGWKFLDETGSEVLPLPDDFSKIVTIVPPPAGFAPAVISLCDVTNPLLGPSGCSRIFGPQKGATPELVEVLETGIRHIADLCAEALGQDFRDTPGAGAAGGIGFGLMAFCKADTRRGFQAIAELLNFEQALGEADLVVTAEGRLDAQSLDGKGPVEVARMARQSGKPVIAFAGGLMDEDKLAGAFDACIPIANRPLSLEESRRDAATLLEAAAERAGRLISLGAKFPVH